MTDTPISDERKKEIAEKLRQYIDGGMEEDAAADLIMAEYSLSEDDVADILTEIDTGLA